MFRCKTKEGRKFKCRPKGALEKRERWLERKNEFIGKMLTIEFVEYTKDGVPVPTVGVEVRDYE